MIAPVLSLDDALAREPTVSGSKAATLARLRSLDFPVPEGVVVTTGAYRRLVDDSAVEDAIDRLDAALTAEADERDSDAPGRATVAADVRAAIEARTLPPDVADALHERLAAVATDRDGRSGGGHGQHGVDEVTYAVRSSATTEDLPGASFAGQYDTHLGVGGGEELERAVVECMASLFTDRAVSYRSRAGIADGVEMAVVVQRMVEPDASGILFTADPLTGDRTVALVDAGPGRGEAQVAGTKTADTLRVDRERGAVVEYRLGEGREERVLTDRDARALAAIGGRVEAALGSPQDVEWALRDGRLSVLQARPVTALFPVPTSPPSDRGSRVYYSFGHRQGMPEAMPPLVADVWRGLIAEVWAEFGLARDFPATAGGRLYLDLTPFLAGDRLRERLLRNFEVVDEPAAAELRALLESHGETFPLAGPSLAGRARAVAVGARLVPLVGGLLRGLPGALVQTDPATTRERVRVVYDAHTDRVVRRIRAGETSAVRLEVARDQLHGVVDWLLEPFYGPFLSALLAGSALRRLAPDPSVVDDLALGIGHDVVYRMTMELDDLAVVAAETPAVETALRDGATLDDLESVPGSEPFRTSFADFLDRYGFRGVGEIDFSRPRYRDDPSILLNVVASTVEAGRAGEHRRLGDRRQQRARDAERRLRAAVSPPLRPLVGHLAAVYREYMGLRERPKFVISRLLAELRAQVLAAGTDLAERGAIPTVDDVWLLTFDELLLAVDDPRTLSGVDVEARRTEFERVRSLPAPRVVTSDGYVPRVSRNGREDTSERAAAQSLRGTGAAPGVVEGVVRVVTDPGTERLARGEVLVAPYTDPGWTPLFVNAAAVVTEVGGRLTHGSLVAREYGIPAVVAVDGATRRLVTGERVRVDGSAGTVERLDDDREVRDDTRDPNDGKEGRSDEAIERRG